ncbi:MAG: TGS domain-containing protein [Phycisphaerales bacterium]|nr:TGS domain-containing protein [Phycisphaerales bacterium]
MVLNLTPDYHEAERKYRQASTTDEKLAALEEMLRTIPKHKSSEKKQSDLKRKIKELKEDVQRPAKKGATLDPYHIPSQGAGQVLLFGLPNSGKSSIVGRLTKAPVKITEFPFGTPLPVPGMAFHEDVPIELVDLPPVTPEHIPGGMINALRNGQVVAVVVDLAASSVLEDVDTLLNILTEKEITTFAGMDDDEEEMAIGPRSLIVCTKADLPGASDNLAVLKELRPAEPVMLPVSSVTGEGLVEMMCRMFTMLDSIRVYSKEPGKPADKSKPFILPAGSTVEELARSIHKDLADKLRFARVWGDHIFAGQQVQGRHVLHDRDIVELHE